MRPKSINPGGIMPKGPVERAHDRSTFPLVTLLVLASLLPNASAAADTTANTVASPVDALPITGKAAPQPGDSASAPTNLECRRTPPVRRPVESSVRLPPGKGSTPTTSESIRITLACVDGNAPTSEKATQDSNLVAQAAAGQSLPLQSNTDQGLAPNSNPRGDQTPQLDLNVLVPAVLSKLIALVLAIACGVLAYAAWRILHQALLVPASPTSPSDSRPEAGAFVFQRHWGGFGGSSTGWTMSDRLVRVIVGLALAALAVSLGMQFGPQEAGRDDKAKAGPEAAASAAKQGK